MKKVVRMLGLCALVALAFTSCKKNDNTNKVTFKATIAQPISNDRTNLNTNDYVIWLEGDEVQVFDENRNTEAFTVANEFSGQTAATFTGDPTFLANIMEAGKYTAFYPVNTFDDNTVTMNTVPATQTYVPAPEGRFADELFPMHATNNDEGVFEFTSDAGVLRIGLYGSDPFTTNPCVVDSIEVIDHNAQVLTGTLTYDNVSRAKNVIPNAEQVNKVVLKCNTNGALLYDQTSREFDIVVLDGAFANGFTVNVYLKDGRVASRTTTKTDNLIEGGHIITMPSFTVTDYLQP